MINDIEKEINGITNWIKEYVQNTKSDGVVVGNSGGKDSATVIALATKALGKENVLAVSMPCNSINKDLDDANLVANTFGVKNLEVDLTTSYKEIENTVLDELKNKDVSNEISEEGKINAKPRLRMLTLYMIARTMNYLVIGTGNKCEIFVGYTTKWGDSASDFNPIANYTVDEVLEIGKYLGVPDEIINKAPNDGLRRKNR